MQRNVKNLLRYDIQATDGELGKVNEFFFDAAAWIVRYLVAETGDWLSNRKVLLSPAFLGSLGWESNRLYIKLTKEQVRNSPASDTDKPISRQHEIELSQYYAWPTYWGSEISSDTTPGMAPTIPAVDASAPGHRIPSPEWQNGLHLRSTRHVIGCQIQAIDGNIGHVDDFILDDKSWEIRYLVVNTRHWLLGPKVLLAPRWLKKIDWAMSKVFVESKRESIKNSPPYDPSKGINTDYEGKLYDYYGRLRIQR
ncbi:hypothetical protein U14_04286 [Candidatus Moduliflexus flocculans]|uniref:PRC-barrel domain protein n=1 Tax=Candidatus Moduliflexus flocculans TaxID=1499966 RepID=A0A0S6W4J0_9BACT|nr:hypothetical protein U14_04286 [Candidatus Moduliflexus flocculans]